MTEPVTGPQVRASNPYEAPRGAVPLRSARFQVVLFRRAAALFLGSAALLSLGIALIQLAALLAGLWDRPDGPIGREVDWPSFLAAPESPTPQSIVAAGLRLSAGLVGVLSALACLKGRWWVTLWSGLLMSGLNILSSVLSFEWL